MFDKPKHNAYFCIQKGQKKKKVWKKSLLYIFFTFSEDKSFDGLCNRDESVPSSSL